MESRIIYNIEKYIAFLFGEKNEGDNEQRIYYKLLRLEGDELENWMNEKIKRYIIGTGYLIEFEKDQFEGIEVRVKFKEWYWSNIYGETGEAMSQDEIFGEKRLCPLSLKAEYKIMKYKLDTFQKRPIYYDPKVDWAMEIFMDYMQMYIMTMTSEDLKAYIIQQVKQFK